MMVSIGERRIKEKERTIQAQNKGGLRKHTKLLV